MSLMQWIEQKESIYDFPGFLWTRGKPWRQMILGLLCGISLFTLITSLFVNQPNPKEFLLLFVRPGAPILLSVLMALGATLLVTAAFCLLLAGFSGLFYTLVGNALHLLWPWGAHRFRALAMAFFSTWALAALFNTFLFVLYRTDLGSHQFVVIYAGQGLEFFYGFLKAPGFFLLVLGVAFPAWDFHCMHRDSHSRATQAARLFNHPDS
ncbi:MAG: hypothetical protein JEZ02_00325 [Desulfatibacillum sp.]|nr:hypothetical protein [Desulfatibacillum sp.]